MRYEFTNSAGEREIIDTADIDYDAVWDALKLNIDERAAAERIIDLFHSSEYQDAASHYRTRRELELESRKMSLVEKLIRAEVLELHGKWWFLRRTPEGLTYRGNEKHYPQAPYRLEPLVLHNLESREITYAEAL